MSLLFIFSPFSARRVNLSLKNYCLWAARKYYCFTVTTMCTIPVHYNTDPVNKHRRFFASCACAPLGNPMVNGCTFLTHLRSFWKRSTYSLVAMHLLQVPPILTPTCSCTWRYLLLPVPLSTVDLQGSTCLGRIAWAVSPCEIFNGGVESLTYKSGKVPWGSLGMGPTLLSCSAYAGSLSWRRAHAEGTSKWHWGCQKRKIFVWSTEWHPVCVVPCYGAHGTSERQTLLYRTTNDMAGVPLDAVITLFRHW